jgi:hypothetical protein
MPLAFVLQRVTTQMKGEFTKRGLTSRGVSHPRQSLIDEPKILGIFFLVLMKWRSAADGYRSKG